MTAEQIDTRSKKVRGMAQSSLDLIEAMYAAAEAAQPITGSGIGYKLFTRGLIPSMARSEMQRVYRLLREAREQGDHPVGVDRRRDSRVRAVLRLGRSPRICRHGEPGISARLLDTAAGPRGGVERERNRARSARSRYSTSTRSASASCTDSAARPRSTMLPRMMTAAT